EELAQTFLVDVEVALGLAGELHETAVTCGVEKRLGDGARERHATREDAVRALLRHLLGLMARGHDLLGALRKLPAIEQPTAHGGVIDSDLLLLALDDRGLTDLARP